MTSRRKSLWAATALASSVLGAPVAAQGIADAACLDPLGDTLPPGCTLPGAGDTAAIATGANTEAEAAGPIPSGQGFVLSLDGETVSADPAVEDRVRQADLALAAADVQISFDALDPQPTLNVELVGAPRTYRAGERVELVGQTNYPAFIDRAEMRVIDRGARGGPRLLQTVPVEVNGRVAITVPEGDEVVVVHRVYDARGRFDETGPLSLGFPDDRGLQDDADDLSDFASRRNIPLRGGTVTVRATNAAPGAVMYTLGEAVPAGRGGTMVIERILPAGDYEVDVEVRGAGPRTELIRPITIPGADWFYVAVADLTLGRFEDGRTGETETRTDGRLQFFVDGETRAGVNVTASLDTGEFELDQIFERLDDRDVEGILDRIDQDYGYPTYGDDSTIVDATPTSGRIYLRVERDNSFAMWGDYKARVAGSHYLRNERSLYGAQVHYETRATTSRGAARLSVDAYAAQPDQIVGRDVFRGTGGSVYFLRRQDVFPGTETLTVELRDSSTGRVIDRQTLVQGQDYDINYVQGVITLFEPLTGSVSPNLIVTNPGGDVDVNLVAQYEYEPSGDDTGDYSTGGRVEGWLTDDLRLGVTAIGDESGLSDQDAAALDLRYEFGDNSFAQLDIARSDGPGFGQTFSLDGGLTIDERDPTGGTGNALRFAAQLDLDDLGMAATGTVGGYFEKREEGFSTLDYQLAEGAGDETLYGVFADVKASERLSYALYADRFEADGGDERTEIGAEIAYAFSDRMELTLAAEHLDEDTATEDGTRTTVGAKLSYDLSPATELFVFGQVAVDSEGLDDYDRFGVGVDHAFANGLSVEAELSGGDGGTGARLLATYARDGNMSRYFGYELDPGRSVEPDLTGEDGGRFVLGAREQINDDLLYYGENTYDVFGDRRERLATYGADYGVTEFLSLSAAIEAGSVTDGTDGDIDRHAVSLGMRYDTEELTARGRLEFRRDDMEAADRGDTDAVFLSFDARYQINDESRLLLDVDYADSDTTGDSLPEGEYTDLSLGYAYRPIANERLNVLARYRYLKDLIGQEVDGLENDGPIQRSHIFSVEGNYDVSRVWTLGAKVGGRISETAGGRGEPLQDNDAYLAVFNARAHVLRNWDVLIEGRHLTATDAELSRSGVLAAVYRHFGDNVKVGVGYNFSTFSDDLSDLTYDDKGAFFNIIAKF